MVKPNWKHEHSKNEYQTYSERINKFSELNLCKHFVYVSFLTAFHQGEIVYILPTSLAFVLTTFLTRVYTAKNEMKFFFIINRQY